MWDAFVEGELMFALFKAFLEREELVFLELGFSIEKVSFLGPFALSLFSVLSFLASFVVSVFLVDFASALESV